MNNVAGVDVSKGKSMVSVLRLFGEVVTKPFSVGHTGSELKELANYLKSLDGETRVVMSIPGGTMNQWPAFSMRRVSLSARSIRNSPRTMGTTPCAK